MRATLLVIEFTVIFNYLFDINSLLAPLHLFRNQNAGYSAEVFYSLAFVLNVVIPAILVSLFIGLSGLVARITVNWGYKLFCAAALIIALTYILFGLTAFSWAVGLVYVPYSILHYLAFPAKVALVVGTIKMLLSLRSHNGTP